MMPGSSAIADNRPVALAQRNFQSVMDTHFESNPLLQRRYDNPNPAASESDVEAFAGVTLSEHHVVPYSKLQTFLNKYRTAVNDTESEDGNPAFTTLAGFVPDDAAMDSAQLNNLQIITNEAKAAIDEADTTPQQWLQLDAESKADIINTIGTAGRRGRARLSLDNWANTMEATRTGSEVEGNEPSTEIVMSYTLWAKGNLFVGPEGAVRSWDPGNGFDTWAQYFLPEGHYAVLSNIYDAIDDAITELNKPEPNLDNESIVAVIENLQTLAANYNAAVEFNSEAWVKPEGSDQWRPAALVE